jgi:hypothetical protein
MRHDGCRTIALVQVNMALAIGTKFMSGEISAM